MNNAINDLINEAKLLSKTVDKLTGIFQNLEQTLQELYCGITFSMPIDEEVEGIKYGYMTWERNSEGNSKLFRLHITYTSDNGTTVMKKPLSHWSIPIRLAMYKHINKFASEFAIHIEKLNEEIMQKIG